jgi:hypothetical protein
MINTYFKAYAAIIVVALILTFLLLRGGGPQVEAIVMVLAGFLGAWSMPSPLHKIVVMDEEVARD